MNKKRFQKVIDAVKATPPKHFDMRTWGRKTDCGFVGCAIGSFCHLNPRAGLKMVQQEWASSGQFTTAYLDDLGGYAVARYLEISHDDMEYCFMPGLYGEWSSPPTKRTVLTRLTAFLKSGGKRPEND